MWYTQNSHCHRHVWEAVRPSKGATPYARHVPRELGEDDEVPRELGEDDEVPRELVEVPRELDEEGKDEEGPKKRRQRVQYVANP